MANHDWHVGCFIIHSGGSRISQRGRQPIIRPNFPQNCMQNKENWVERRPKFVLCRSATDSYVKDRTPNTLNVLTETFSILVNEQCQGHTKSYHY